MREGFYPKPWNTIRYRKIFVTFFLDSILLLALRLLKNNIMYHPRSLPFFNKEKCFITYFLLANIFNKISIENETYAKYVFLINSLTFTKYQPSIQDNFIWWPWNISFIQIFHRKFFDRKSSIYFAKLSWQYTFLPEDICLFTSYISISDQRYWWIRKLFKT